MDTKKISLIGNIVKVLIAVVGAIYCVLILFNSDDIEMGNKHNLVSGALTLSYIGMVVCIGVALLFGLVYFFKNIAKSKGMIIGLVGFAIIAFISYSLADGDLTPKWEALNYTETTSKLSGAGIYLTGLLLIVTVAAALFSEVNKLFK